MRKFSITFVFIFLSMFLVACGKKVESITLNEDDITLKIGEKFNLVATFTPKDSKNKDLIWESSDNDIVSVDRGVIKAVMEGSVIVSAKSSNKKIARCKVTVTETVTETPGQIIELNEDNYKDYIEFVFGQNETSITHSIKTKLNYRIQADYTITFSTRLAIVYKNVHAINTYYQDFELTITDGDFRGSYTDVFSLAMNKRPAGYGFSSFSYTTPDLKSIKITVYN